MGSFSWCLMDTKTELMLGEPFKVLIPEDFGGGAIETVYEDYGRFEYEGVGYDLYEILAAWNTYNTGIANNEQEIPLNAYGLVNGSKQTGQNRRQGINMGCHEEEAAELDYPLRLVSIMDTSTYEDYEGKLSPGAPHQGWDGSTEYEDKYFRTDYYRQEG